MADIAQPQRNPATASFVEHVRAFHQSLPNEERLMLEEIFALAEEATKTQADVQGFAFQWGTEALQDLGSQPFWRRFDPAKPS